MTPRPFGELHQHHCTPPYNYKGPRLCLVPRTVTGKSFVAAAQVRGTGFQKVARNKQTQCGDNRASYCLQCGFSTEPSANHNCSAVPTPHENKPTQACGAGGSSSEPS